MKKNYCNKCGACCNNIVVDLNKRVLYRDGVQPLLDNFLEMLVQKETNGIITICSCSFLKENLCTNPDKPNECQDFPSSPFAFLPDNCGFEGDIFMKLENIKQKIRKLKEEIIYYETILPTDKSVKRIIDQNKIAINKYKIYGSLEW